MSLSKDEYLNIARLLASDDLSNQKLAAQIAISQSKDIDIEYLCQCIADHSIIYKFKGIESYEPYGLGGSLQLLVTVNTSWVSNLYDWSVKPTYAVGSVGYK